MMAKARIAVIGAGLMGHGIAQVFALAGHDVSIQDSVAANLDSAKARIRANLRDLGDDLSAVERVRPTAGLAEAVREADYVVEAVLEDLPLKQKLFVEIEENVRPHTILASNTSVIPITKIMEGLRDRSRALGTHWWNGPWRYIKRRAKCRCTSKRTCPASSAIACSTRYGGRRSPWSSAGFAMPRPWIP